jgi:hypothetical protein
MKTTITVITLLVMAFSLGGCATEPSRVEMDYSTSYKLAIYNQTLNPDAEKNLEPVSGIEGQVAEKIVEKYEKSFEKPLPASPTFSITVPGVAMK